MSEWNKIVDNDSKPNYYHGVAIVANGKIHYDWHRLDDGDSEYYGSLETDFIIEGSQVTHWRELLSLPDDIKVCPSCRGNTNSLNICPDPWHTKL